MTAAAGLESELTWNAVVDVRQVLAFPFVVNALCAGRRSWWGPV